MTWLTLLRRIFGGSAEATPTPPQGDPERVLEVEAVLQRLRPAFRADGGDIVLVAVEGGRVDVRLRGACSGCAASTLTLRGALEPALRERLAWFERLRAL